MPKDKGETKPSMADALVDLVHAGQGIRRAARNEAVQIAKKANDTAGRVMDALGDL